MVLAAVFVVVGVVATDVCCRCCCQTRDSPLGNKLAKHKEAAA